LVRERTAQGKAVGRQRSTPSKEAFHPNGIDCYLSNGPLWAIAFALIEQTKIAVVCTALIFFSAITVRMFGRDDG
jgi:hypothetical protein